MLQVTTLNDSPAHAPATHTASHVDNEKELHGFLILLMHVFYSYSCGALLGAPL